MLKNATAICRSAAFAASKVLRGVTVQGSYQKSCTNTPNRGALPVTSPLLICNTHRPTQAAANISEDVRVTAAYHCKVIVVSETSRPCVAVQSQTDDEQEGIYTLMLCEHSSCYELPQVETW